MTRTLPAKAATAMALGVLVACTPDDGDRHATRNGYVLTHELVEFACYDRPAGSGKLDGCSVDIPIMLDFPDQDISRIAYTEISYFCEFDVTYLVEGSSTPRSATGRGESNFVPTSGATMAEDYMVAQLPFDDEPGSVRSAEISGYRCALM